MRYFDEYAEMQKDYPEGEEYLVWIVYSEREYLDRVAKYPNEPGERNRRLVKLNNGKRYFNIAATDDNHSYRLTYEFAKAYLELHKDRILMEEWSRVCITYEDIVKVESNGGYRSNWMNGFSTRKTV